MTKDLKMFMVKEFIAVQLTRKFAYFCDIQYFEII